MGHTPKDYLQVYNMTAQRSTSPSVKLDNKENVWRGYFHRAAVRKTRVVYLFVGPLLFFCPFFHFPSRADWIILSRGSRISVGSLRRIYSPRTDGLEERVCEWDRERGREREVSERADGWVAQCSNILGQYSGVHIVDSSLVITTVTFLTATFHALVGAWCTIRPV